MFDSLGYYNIALKIYIINYNLGYYVDIYDDNMVEIF